MSASSNRSHTQCVDCATKLFPYNFEKSQWEHLNSRFKKMFSRICFYTSKVAITTTLCKLRIFQDSFCMFKTLKIKMWKCLLKKISKVIFPYWMCTKCFWNFCQLYYTSQEGARCVEPSKTLFTCTLLNFDFQNSF